MFGIVLNLPGRGEGLLEQCNDAWVVVAGLKLAHRGAQYDVSHLAARVVAMGAWTRADKQPLNVEVEIRYSCHCYTVDSQDAPPAGAWHLREPREWRIFDEQRHALSAHIPDIIETLVRHPTKQIQQVSGRNNFKIFRVGLDGVRPGERYYVFLKLTRSSRIGSGGFHQIRLSVESAYPRHNIVAGKWRPPFGTAVAEVLGLR